MPFMIKCIGGPTPGDRYTDDLSKFGLSWPLPDKLTLPKELAPDGGAYFKVSESQLPPEAAKQPTVGVGAVFEWREDAAND